MNAGEALIGARQAVPFCYCLHSNRIRLGVVIMSVRAARCPALMRGAGWFTGSSHGDQYVNAETRIAATIPSAHSSENNSTRVPDPRVRGLETVVRNGM